MAAIWKETLDGHDMVNENRTLRPGWVLEIVKQVEVMNRMRRVI